MAITDLPLLGMLKTRMKWHQARQSVLAQNVANADTPGFRPSDLRPLEQGGGARAPKVASLAVSRTNAEHIAGRAVSAGGGPFKSTDAEGWETTPAGNAVVLEEQMIEVSANQFDYQMASTLYARSLGLLKTALGRQG